MRAHQFLLEYDRSREQQRIESLPAYQTRLKQDPGFSLERLESADPTTQKIYVPRLATWWLRGAKLEDLISRGADALEKFVQLKQKNLLKPEHKDINGFKQFTEFETTLSRYQLPGQSAQAPEDRGRFKQIYRDPELIVVRLLDETAAQWWGQGTKWCTAAKNNNQFDHYHRKGPIYVIIDRVANAKYQYWWKDNDEYDMQFMDARDQEYDPRGLSAFAQLQKIFQPLCAHIMWNPNPSEAVQLTAVRQNINAIRWITNPSEAVQLAAVERNDRAIRWISKPSERTQLAAVQQDGHNIDYILQPPSEAVQLAAVQQNGRAIQYIANPSEAVQLTAVRQNINAIQWITNPSEAVQLAAVERNDRAIRWISKPSERTQLAAVQQDGENIDYILRNPSEAVQLAAVQQNGRAIQYIANPSEDVQLAAVQQDGRAILFITDPTEAVQLAAVQQDGYVIQFISNPTEAVQLAAVRQNDDAIEYITNPSEAVQLAAVRRNSKAIQYIRKPTPKVRALYRRLTGG